VRIVSVLADETQDETEYVFQTINFPDQTATAV
jgi:hypothetical protein